MTNNNVPCASPHTPPQVLGEETKGEAIITTGVGQHQMFAAQWYPYSEPRRWITSGGIWGGEGGGRGGRLAPLTATS